VSKKHHHRPSTGSAAMELRLRIERARQEGRFQQALDLTKQLYKYEPKPEHLNLLKEVYLGRARQLREQGQTRDALTVLEVASRLETPTPEWQGCLAEEMVLCGGVSQALALLENLPDEAVKNRLLARIADVAVQQEAEGKSSALPPEMRAELQRVLLAFQQVEAGRDEEARQTLQGIGLRSSFLEWKLLLRGLQAYWTNDNDRAIENWQRLTPDRLTARLAAPFRYRIDTAFRNAQQPAVQAMLHKQIERLEGSPLASKMRSLQAALANRKKMAEALRQAEAVLPTLRHEAPHLVPRLASCFYWAILEAGPDEVLRYKRVFGAPSDDPDFHRLQAIGYERVEELQIAHKHWQQYESEIAAHPERWPGKEANHARALIWQRMAHNAVVVGEQKKMPRSPFGFFEDEQLAPLSPSAEKCFQKSLELASDILGTHTALVQFHLEAKREAKAEKAARQLLKHFPDHVPTLELLGDLKRGHGDYEAALDLFQQAIKGNPLDRQLRRKLSDAYLLLARKHTDSSQFDEARQSFQPALDLETGPDGAMILAYWAGCEFKAQNEPRAEELLQQAMARTTAPVGIAFLLLTQVHGLKLPRALKTRFDAELKTGLANPTPEGAVFLTRIVAGLHAGGVRYVGSKGHAQKVVTYVNKTAGLLYTEPQLEDLCRNLLDMEALVPAKRFADIGEQKYPNNPFFPFFHAMGWFKTKGRNKNSWRVANLLRKSLSLIEKQPSNERLDRLQQDVEKILHEVSPFDIRDIGRLIGLGEMPDLFDMEDEDADDEGME
jgi:tetratricopeptide (TPR) repeat protein